MNELYHHGIKGQKWGIRRYQPYPKGSHGTFLGQSRDDDIVIKKGTEAYRVQSTDKLSGSGHSYISFNKLDHMNYLLFTASGEGGVAIDATVDNGNESRPYSVQLNLTKDIIAPSYQRSMDAFVKTVGDVGIKEVSKTINDKDIAKQFVKDYRKMNVEECRDRAYINFVRTFMKDSKARQVFFKELESQGYNAIVDEWDNKFGSNTSAETPMIVFDKSDTLKKTSAKAITKEDTEYFNEIIWGGGVNQSNPRYQNEIEKWDDWAGSSKYRYMDYD